MNSPDFFSEENAADHSKDNLRKAAITHLIDHFKFADDADVATREFYLNEITKVNLTNPASTKILLESMRAYWPTERIAAFGRQEYDRNMAYAKEQLRSGPLCSTFLQNKRRSGPGLPPRKARPGITGATARVKTGAPAPA